MADGWLIMAGEMKILWRERTEIKKSSVQWVHTSKKRRTMTAGVLPYLLSCQNTG